MSFATATLDNFTTVTAALAPVTETPVTRDPTEVEARDYHRSAFDYMLYVTRTDSDGRRAPESLIGTVVKVLPSGQRNGWLWRNESGLLHRVFGAPLNRGMVDGRYYRSLNGAGILARYNDEDHRSARNIESLPMSILATNGTTWPVPGDGQTAWGEAVPYIEVESPAAEAAPEPVDAHQFVTDITVSGPTRGFAEVNAAGRVELDPALEVGGFYLYWTTAGEWDEGRLTEARMVRAITDGTPEFTCLGYWSMERRNGERVPAWYSSRSSVLDTSTGQSWAKLALTDPVPNDTDEAATVQGFRTLLTSEAAEFAEFNEATNELAKDNDWCSEYEGIIEPLGMEGRSKTVHDYDVEVTASITFEADSVSSRIDSHVADDYNIPGISLDSARFRGSVTVTIRVEDVSDDDDASDSIDSDRVLDHLNDLMSGVDDIEVDDYSIQTTRMVD